MNLKLEINPQGVKNVFHKNINTAFPGWGEISKYEWTYERPVGHLDSDTMILKDDEGTILAGSGISYRTLATASNEMLNIGIMTGSWTLPAARRKGCFTKIIDVSEELTFNKKADYLCGFLAGTNPSYGRLNAASRFMKPTAYMFSPTQTYAATEYKKLKLVKEFDDDLIQKIYLKNNETIEGYTHFVYSLEDFKNQFIYRPGNIDIIEFPDENFAVIEETSDVIKVQLLTWKDSTQFSNNIKCLVNWSLSERQKKLLVFSSLADITEVCKNLNFDIVPGFFHIIITDKSKKEIKDDDILKIFKSFNASNGDKM